MGVKHFYYWYSRRFKNCIETTKPYAVSILGIDMNGIFHGCAQKIYRYGNFANTVPVSYTGRVSLLRKNPTTRCPIRITPMMHQQFKEKLFAEISQRVVDIVRDVGPTETLVLCVDGVAGLGKMNQQRQRRFRTSQDRKEGDQEPEMTKNIPPFNPNQFTPGTVLMDHLTKYLDGFIRKKQEDDPHWRSLRIIFSNEKAPGEGEHKIMHYIRQYASSKDTVCIYGMDADLVMLAMLLPTKNVLIAREIDYYRHEYIVVSDFLEKVLNELNWENEETDHPYSGSNRTPTLSSPSPVSEKMRFHKQRATQDFIVLCFLVGNDFLPTIPALSIMDGGLHLMFETYRKNGVRYGHLTHMINGQVLFGSRSMGAFLEALSVFEKEVLEKKYNSGASFHHDPIVIRHSSGAPGNLSIDMDGLRHEFYESKFPSGTSVETICRHYADGMLWVANYYRSGIPDWLWCFPYLYGPFLQDLAAYWKTHRPKVFRKHQPVDPLLQLIMVLPPSDQKEMVPPVLHLMNEADLKPFFPETVTIDLGGKKKDWEGIVQIPMIPYQQFASLYATRKPNLPSQDARRNIRGRTFVYTYQPSMTPYDYASFYFTLPQCRIKIENIILPH